MRTQRFGQLFGLVAVVPPLAAVTYMEALAFARDISFVRADPLRHGVAILIGLAGALFCLAVSRTFCGFAARDTGWLRLLLRACELGALLAVGFALTLWRLDSMLSRWHPILADGILAGLICFLPYGILMVGTLRLLLRIFHIKSDP